MTTFLLIRHASTAMVGHAISGWQPGVHLNAEGLTQAGRLSRRLRRRLLTAIYSSPLERALETAAPLSSDSGIPVRISFAFGEIQFGDWTGRTIADLDTEPEWARFNTQRGTTRIPGGESMLEVQSRVLTEIQALCARHPEGAVAVFSHADVIKAAIAHYAGIPLDFFFRFEISPASVSVMEVHDYGPRILSLNDTGEFCYE